MAKNKKSLFGCLMRGILYLFLTLIVLVIVAYLFSGQIVKKAISIVVPPITQTEASIDDVDLSLFRGYVAITGLKLSNPQGFSSQNIFEMGRVVVTFEPKSLLSSTIIVRSVIMEGTSISVEMSAKGQTNVGVLNQNIQNYLNTHQSIEPKASNMPSESQSDKKVIIQDLAITDSHLTLGMAGQMTTINLPNIYQKNIGTDNDGKTIPEMIAQILSYFSAESVRGAADAVRNLAGQGIAGAAQLLSTGKNSVMQKVNFVKGSVDSEAADIVEGIKGLF